MNTPPFPDYFSMFQQIVGPLAGQGAAAPDQAAKLLMASLDPKEIEKKIAELKTVHAWLTAQAGVVEMTIKTLEYQHAMLISGAMGKAGADATNPAANPAAWAWSMMQQPFAETLKETTASATKATKKPTTKKKAPKK